VTPALAASFERVAALSSYTPTMKITRIETTYWRSGSDLPWKPNWVWVRIHTDSGLVGLGETYPRNEVEASMVHSTIAGLLLGRDPRDIERIWADLYRTFDFQVTGGAEMRALSAIDLALWDLLGELNQDGQTILLTTHYMEEADKLCERVAVMDHGRILALGTPAALKQSVGADTVVTVKTTGDPEGLGALLTDQVGGVTRTRLSDGHLQLHVKGTPGLVSTIVSTAERGGFDILDLSIAEPSLETVFINLTGKELRD